MRRALLVLSLALSGCGGCEPPEPVVPVVKSVERVSEAVSSAVAAVSARVEQLSKDVGELRTKVDAWFPIILNRLDVLEQRVEQLEQKDEFGLQEGTK